MIRLYLSALCFTLCFGLLSLDSVQTSNAINPRPNLRDMLGHRRVYSGSGVLLGVSSNAKQSVNGCCFEHWLLEAHRFAPHSRRGGAVGTPPSRLSPIPPRASRLFAASLAKCAASPACGSSCLIGKALRGLAPAPPVSLATPRGQGERRKRRAPITLPTGRVCSFGGAARGIRKES